MNQPKKFCKKKQLLDEEWDYLINLYQGNPYYLKIIARVIKEYFLDSVKNFLASNQQPFLDEKIKLILKQQLNRLTEVEKEILSVLAQENKSIISFNQLQLLVKVLDLIDNIKSLKRRNLVKQIQLNENEIVFEISPILREFLLTLS